MRQRKRPNVPSVKDEKIEVHNEIESTVKKSYWEYICEPVDNSALVAYRIMWGIIMFYECIRFSGDHFKKADVYYVQPEFYGKYYGFEWVETWGRDGIHLHFYLMMLAAFGITVGLCYPISALFFAFSWTYIILIDSTIYLNHFYLLAVIAFLLVMLPANRCTSLDALLFPCIYSTTMPRYVLWVLRIYQVIVYFFAGIAKVNEDWLRGEPVKHWLALDMNRLTALRALVGPDVVKIMCSELSAYFICYGGLLFDLFIGFFLLLPRGILWYFALTACIFFHTMNKFFFNIGIFPQIMLASTTLFFEPNWARKYIPFLFSKNTNSKRESKRNSTLFHKLMILLLVIFLCHQIVMPLRSHFYEGDVAWNEKGHRWSWRMKLRDKVCSERTFGYARDINRTIHLDLKTFCVGKQYRKIIMQPVELVQLAHYISKKYTERHNTGHIEIYSDVWCSLNYRPEQRFINRSVDLASYDYWDYSDTSLVHALKPLSSLEQKEYPWNWDWEKIQWLMKLQPISLQ